jgi:hypothetical protein
LSCCRGRLWDFDAAAIFPELGSMAPGDAMPDRPLDKVALRHTVGMVDPITAADLAMPTIARRMACRKRWKTIWRTTTLSYLKIKLGGDVDADCARLEADRRGDGQGRSAYRLHAGRQ